jgi:hypothetical protein
MKIMLKVRMKRSTFSQKCCLLSNIDVVKYAEKYSDFVVGFISQSRLTTTNKYFHCTPGKSIGTFLFEDDNQ